MSREYCFNLTVPLEDVGQVDELLARAKQDCPPMRISRKPDRKDYARFYLSFPFSSSRPDLSFQDWFGDYLQENWDLHGPNPGRWGLT